MRKKRSQGNKLKNGILRGKGGRHFPDRRKAKVRQRDGITPNIRERGRNLGKRRAPWSKQGGQSKDGSINFSNTRWGNEGEAKEKRNGGLPRQFARLEVARADRNSGKEGLMI